MPTLDVFNNDAFSVLSLTASVNEMDQLPTKLGDEGLFEEDGVTTTTIQVEKKGDNLKLVTAKERGQTGQTSSNNKRNMVPFNLVHLPQPDSILADSIQNIRSFGSESEVESVMGVVNTKLLELKRNNDATLEWQRMGAIKGKILDADGTTVLEDIYSRFGVSQPTKTIAVQTDGTKIRQLVNEAKTAASKKLGGVVVSQWRAKCAPDFFNSMIENVEVKAAYDRWMNGEGLRSDMQDGFMYAGVFWEPYDAIVDGKAFIASGEAYLYPVGVPDMFITRFGPADYMETVNTKGLPYYAKTERMKFDKGIDIEVQSNTLSLCTRPSAVTKIKTA
uniref:Phage major capsid protein E n=1 Tax=Hydrogenovibrio crunogenus (strain DSM 25203 / XCL-2) TaxID=317025 RepID=Q31HU5_HYDCU